MIFIQTRTLSYIFQHTNTIVHVVKNHITQIMASSSLQQEKCNHGDDTRNIVLKKGTWSNEEDQLLREYVIKYGVGKWDSVRKKTELARDGKSCRLRWLNHLNPILKKCSFNEEEGRKLIHLYNELGPKWS